MLNALLITSIIRTRQSEMKIDLALIHIGTVLWLTVSDIVLYGSKLVNGCLSGKQIQAKTDRIDHFSLQGESF